MTKEEVKNYVEDIIDYHCDEFGLEREEVIETVMINIIFSYERNELTKEDLLKCADYLEYELDMDVIDADIEKRKAQREKRRLSKQRKKAN